MDASIDGLLEQLSAVLDSPTVAMYMWSHGSGGLELQRSAPSGQRLPTFVGAPSGIDLDEPDCLDLLKVGQQHCLAPIRSDIGVIGAIAYEEQCSLVGERLVDRIRRFRRSIAGQALLPAVQIYRRCVPPGLD